MTLKKISKFYSEFFSKETFLSHKKKNYDYLLEQGFYDSKIKNSKSILEIGAGKGRYTIQIYKKKIFKNLSNYHVIEPSESIINLKKKIKSKKFYFHQKDFYSAVINLIKSKKKFDLILFSMVIPHIDLRLSQIFMFAKKVLKKNGKIKIISNIIKCIKSPH